jgi:hypothetical protein
MVTAAITELPEPTIAEVVAPVNRAEDVRIKAGAPADTT